VRRSHHLEDLRSSHLLFISRSERGRLSQIFDELGPGSVLTVGDVEGFAREGGGINFYVENNKLAFEINLFTARNRGIRLSSQLLSLGKIVERDRGQ